MPDPTQGEAARVAELRRQRDLVAGHLAWLESEIAAATGGLRVSGTPGGVTTPTGANPRAGTFLPKQVEYPDLSTPGAGHKPVSGFGSNAPFPEAAAGISPRERLGCIVAAAVVLLLIAAAIFVLPYFIYRR